MGALRWYGRTTFSSSSTTHAGATQKPRRKARERNDKEVARWVDDDFRRIVREAFRRRAYIAFLDESGFHLTPTVRRTGGPVSRPQNARWSTW